MNDDTTPLRRILTRCKTIAVVGLSAEPDRPSFTTAKYMQEQGYRIVPVTPKYAEILGEKCYASLSDIPFSVDMVNVFRKPQDVLPIAQEAVKIGATCFWQQLGIANLEAAAWVEHAGLDSVMDLCVKIEHARMLSRWHGV